MVANIYGLQQTLIEGSMCCQFVRSIRYILIQVDLFHSLRTGGIPHHLPTTTEHGTLWYMTGFTPISIKTAIG